MATRKTLFSMAYWIKAISSVKVGLPSPNHLQFNEISNYELRTCELDFLDEKRNESQIKLAIYQYKWLSTTILSSRRNPFEGRALYYEEYFYPLGKFEPHQRRGSTGSL